MLYKLPTGTRAVRKPSPARTARETVQQVAIRLGKGSQVRALMAFAQEKPEEFWKLYGKTIERDAVNIQVNTGPQTWTIGDKEVEF